MLYRAHLCSVLLTFPCEGEYDCLQHEAPCTVLLDSDGAVTLRYDDPDRGGQTRLQLSPTMATIAHGGSTRSRLPFRVGDYLPCHYETPEGLLDLHTHTTKLRFEASPAGGSLTLRYALYMGGRFSAYNLLRLTWQAC